MHGVIEDFLRGGGFEARILSSGEEALTLFKGKVADYKALVTDIDRRRAGWWGSSSAGQGKWLKHYCAGPWRR
jgi:hypothetical protein